MLSSLLLASALTFAPIQAQAPTDVVETPVVEEEQPVEDESTLVEDIKGFVEEHLSINAIVGVVNGFVSSGAIFTALGVYLSKRKQGLNIEKAVLETLNKQLGTSFKSFKDEELKEFIRKQDITQDAIKLMVKALVLAQDKTAEGKKALVDLMIECNEKLGGVDKETTQVLNHAKEEIVKEQVKTQEVNKKVESEYIPVD